MTTNNTKRLLRTPDGIIAGVCGGLANYFDIDPTIVRVVFALIGLFWGAGILAYFIMALVIPENPYEIVD